MRRKTVTIGVSYLCGLFLASFLSVEGAAALLSVLSVITVAVALLMRDRIKSVMAVGVSLCLAVSVYLVYTVFVYEAQLSYVGQEVTFCGKAIGSEYITGDKVLYTLKGELGGANAEISFISDDRTLEYGDRVTVKATLSETENNLYFSGKDYYKAQGVFLSGGYAQILNVKSGGFSLGRLVIRYRDYLTDVIMSFLPKEEGGLICAMLCGNTSFVSSELKNVMTKTGLLHIFSVSGLHLVIIYHMISALAKATGLGKKTRLCVCELFILVFVLFAGATVSVIRAAVMMSVHNLASIFRRDYDCLSSVVLCVVMITAGRPYVILSAPLVLSAFGALALGWIAPKVITLVSPTKYLYRFKISALSMTTVSVVTLVVNVIFFNEVSTVSIVTNILLVPLCSVPLCLSAAVALTGGVAILAKPLIIVAGYVAKVFLFLCRIVASLPFVSVPTGYMAVKYTTVVCFAAAVLYVIMIRKISISSVIMFLSAYVCFIAVSIANRLALSDTVLIYKLCDEDMQAVIVVYGSEAVAVNLSGSGAIAEAIPTLMQSKGIREITGFYDLDGAPTVYSAYSEFLNLEKAEIVQDEAAVKLCVSGTEIVVAQDFLNNAECDVMLCSDSVALISEGVSFTLCNDIEEIMISDDKTVVRRLRYGFVE